MSESESQTGCSKHGPFSVCKHTDADCPDPDMENPTGKEEKREYIPTPEEVIAIIKEIIGEKEYTETRRASDDKGLYFLEILIKDPKGNIEYEYKRKGDFPEGSMSYKNFTGVINVAFYDTDGDAVGGHNVADFIDGQWKKT